MSDPESEQAFSLGETHEVEGGLEILTPGLERNVPPEEMARREALAAEREERYKAAMIVERAREEGAIFKAVLSVVSATTGLDWIDGPISALEEVERQTAKVRVYFEREEHRRLRRAGKS